MCGSWILKCNCNEIFWCSSNHFLHWKVPEISKHYCDEVNNIKKITANITDHQGSYQYVTGQYHFLNITARTFNVVLKVNYSTLWRPFMFSLSLENSVGASPFCNQVLVRGAINGNDLLNIRMLKHCHNC